MAEHKLICEMCHKEFIAQRKSAIYCSNSCKRKGAYRGYRRYEVKPQERVCEKCGDVHVSGNRLYCPPCHTVLTNAMDGMCEGVFGLGLGENIKDMRKKLDRVTDHSKFAWNKGYPDHE